MLLLFFFQLGIDPAEKSDTNSPITPELLQADLGLYFMSHSKTEGHVFMSSIWIQVLSE